MKKSINKFLVGTVCLLAPAVTLAQDIHFSQFYSSPLTLNPGLTGAYSDIQAVLNYKDQWKAVASPYKTYAASYDMRLMKGKWKNGFLGAGLNVFSDKAGDAQLGTTDVNLSISSSRKIDDDNDLALGLQAGFTQRSITTDKFQWGNQYNGSAYDPTISADETFSTTKMGYPDFSAGLLWHYGKGEMYIAANDQLKMDAGIAMFHFTRPGQSFYDTSSDRLDFKYVVHGSAHIGIKNTKFSIEPSVMVLLQGPAQEINVGGMFRYFIKEDAKYTGFVKSASISVGGHYRAQDAFILSTMLNIANYGMGISYDMNTSDLRAASSGRGGFEISLRYVTGASYLYKGFSQY